MALLARVTQERGLGFNPLHRRVRQHANMWTALAMALDGAFAGQWLCCDFYHQSGRNSCQTLLVATDAVVFTFSWDWDPNDEMDTPEPSYDVLAYPVRVREDPAQCASTLQMYDTAWFSLRGRNLASPTRAVLRLSEVVPFMHQQMELPPLPRYPNPSTASFCTLL